MKKKFFDLFRQKSWNLRLIYKICAVDKVITLKKPLQITSNVKTLGFWFYSNKSYIGTTPLVIKNQDHLVITLNADSDKI